MVQKMNPQPSGKLKKYEPLEPREFVDFSEYNNITLKNVKNAFEKFYGERNGSCDVLYSDRGPSCIDDEQLSGKKVFLIRFFNTGHKEKSQQRC